MINRNDLNALKQGIQALKHKNDLTASEKLPMVYLAGGARFGYAPNREDQKNPFVYDDFNYIGLGAFVGVKWDINLLTPTIYEKQEQAQIQIQEENLQLLKSKVRIEVSDAYNKIIENTSLLEAIKQSINDSETWLALSLDNWEMGFGDAEKLIKAYNTYYQLKAQELELKLKFHQSLASFAVKISSFEKYLEWINEGKVFVD